MLAVGLDMKPAGFAGMTGSTGSAMDDIRSLFRKQISWQLVKPGGAKFYAYVDGERCELWLNDFPEKPLYTLVFGGQSIDFDDRPEIWSLPLGQKGKE
jgi:hypothetical protein